MTAVHVEYPCSPGAAAEALLWANERAGQTLVVGGGTLTVAMLTQGILNPTHVVDLGRANLDGIHVSSSRVGIGSTVSYQQLITSPEVAELLPLLHRMASGITGGIQIRNQGTLGGAACAARPFSDAPAVLVALGAQMRLISHRGIRIVSATDFFQGAEVNALAEDEILLDMEFPLHQLAGRSSGYQKLKFAESSWPVVTAACLYSSSRLDVPSALEITIGGVGDTPLSVNLSNVSLDGPYEDVIVHAIDEAVRNLPTERRWSDIRAGTEYRARVAGEIACRAFLRTQENKRK